MHFYPDEKQNRAHRNTLDQTRRCVIACKVLWREISYLVSRSPYVYDVFFLEQGLHDEPGKLNRRLQEAITDFEKKYPLILVGYGLCSNGIEGILSSRSTLVFIRAHDCITFFLGSKKRFRSMFDCKPGTYWYGTGWMETSNLPDMTFYKNKFAEYTQRYEDEETAKYLIQSEQEWTTKYQQLIYIRQGIIDESDFILSAKKSAEYYQWSFDCCEGDLSLLKDWIEGQWDPQRFLVLEPGESVIPSYDEDTIITKKNDELDN